MDDDTETPQKEEYRAHDVLFLDTETTGFGPCRIIELAYAQGQGEIVCFRAKNPIPIEAQAVEVHGITEEDLAALPLFTGCPQYAPAKEIIQSSMVVAHGGRFDVDALARDDIHVARFIDTKVVARKLWPSLKSHRLQDLRAEFHLLVEGSAHSAAGDVSVLRALYGLMAEILIREGCAPVNVATKLYLLGRGV